MYRSILLILWCSQLLGQDNLSFDTTAFSINLDEFVITGQYEPSHYKSANHKVEIISKEEIKQRGAVTLDQALVINPSIRIGYDPVLGSTVRMRGISSNNVAILMDGVPVIGRLDANIDLSQINLQQIERIEIVEGALSNIYGSNAAGGVINLITQKSQAQDIKFDMSTQLESIGQQSISANLGYKLDKLTMNLNGRLFNYNQHSIDSLRLVEPIPLADGTSILQSKYPFNPKEQMGYGGFLRYDPNNESSVLFKYDFNNENVTDYGIIKRPQFNPYTEDRFYKTTRSDFSLNYKKSWDKTFIETTSAINVFNRIFDDKRFYLETSEFDSLLQKSDTTHFKTLFNRTILSHTFNNKIKAITGVNYTNERGSGERILDRNNADSTSANFIEIAPFLELNYNISNQLLLLISGRYMIHSIYDNRITPSLMLKYALDDKLIFRLGYAQGYRSPSLKELYLEFIDVNHNIIGNTNLSPELSHDLQFTADYQLQPNMNLSLNVFHTTITDRIDLFEYETLKFIYDNIDQYRVYGFQPEINYSYKKLINFSSSASVSYWATNIDAENAPRYGNVIDINNNVEINFAKLNLKFIINHRHIGKEPIYRIVNDELQINTIQDYELIDLSFNTSFLNKKLSLTSGIRNILNITATSILGTTGQSMHGNNGRNAVNTGRSIFVNMSYSIGK